MRRFATSTQASIASAASLVVGVAIVVLAICGGGCEAIVPGTVGTFHCESSAASSCPPGEVCATSTGQCIPAAQSCAITGCMAPLVCDPGSLQCVNPTMMTTPDSSMPVVDSARPPPADVVVPVDSTPPPADSKPPVDVTVVDSSCGVGCSCTTASACKANLFCADNTVLPGLADTPFCTTACCSSNDCPAGSVCYASGTPGSYCVPAALLNIAATGTALGGATCAANGDCRSGTCDTSGTCLDTCCSDSSCQGGAFCALDETTPATIHQGFYCLAESPPGVPPDGTCFGNADCSSNACLQIGTCTTNCCGAGSCGAAGGNSCGTNKTSMTGNDSVNVCGTGSNGGEFGTNCGQDTACTSQVCDTSPGKCTDFCCVDTDCAGFGNYVCRPRTSAPHYLICVRAS
jgi:hypothetical protein